jgi:hypothetical protein
VVLKSLDEPDVTKPGRGTPSVKEMHEKYKVAFAKFIKDESIQMTADARRKLDDAIEKEVTRLSQGKEVGSNITNVADSLAKIAMSALPEGNLLERGRKIKMRNSFRDVLRSEFVALSKPPPRLTVLVKTSEIKEAGPSDIVAKFHLKITEGGFEWSSSETAEGEKNVKLVPE